MATPITAADIAALDNDCALIRSAAQALGRVGSPAIEHTRRTINAWRRAEAAYEAPEAPTLLAALDPTMPVAHRVFDRVVGAERALTAYADTAEPLIRELRALLATSGSTPEAAPRPRPASARWLLSWPALSSTARPHSARSPPIAPETRSRPGHRSGR
jgi:hypothetical protein